MMRIDGKEYSDELGELILASRLRRSQHEAERQQRQQRRHTRWALFTVGVIVFAVRVAFIFDWVKV